MNCQDFESMVRDLTRAETRDRKVEPLLSASDRERAFVHVDACAACALKLQDEQALSRGLEALVTEMKSLEPPARIEAELLHAFRHSVSPLAVSPAAVSQLSARQTGRGTYWLIAAAAVVLLIFGVVLLRSKLLPPSQGPDAGPTIEAKAPALDSTPVRDAGTAVSNDPQSIPRKVLPARDNHELAIHQVRSRREFRRGFARRPSSLDGIGGSGNGLTASEATPATTENQNETEIATQFIALSYAGPASLQDGGQIVRVELPRSAMASLGLPVNVDRFGERVKADVLVSADGFARAIRFVQ